MNDIGKKSIAESFDEYFRIRLADTDTLRKAVYKVRYDVYCEELGWEEDCPKDVEKDLHDEHSVHCLLEHKRTNEFAGCIRLVNTSETDRLPFEVNCKEAIDPNIIDPTKLRRGSFGEISRLAVPATFRKRKGEQGKPFVIEDEANSQNSNYSEVERRQFPNIAIGLYLSSLAYADLLELDYIFVMMEPRLKRHLKRFGILFEQAGNEIDFHGTRGLFYLEKKNLSSHFPEPILELYQLIYSRMDAQWSNNR